MDGNSPAIGACHGRSDEDAQTDGSFHPYNAVPTAGKHQPEASARSNATDGGSNVSWEPNIAYAHANQSPELQREVRERQLDDLRTMHDALEAQVQAQQGEVQERDARIDQLSCQLSAVEGEVIEAAAALTDAETELEQQAALLEAQQKQIQTLTQQLEVATQAGDVTAAIHSLPPPLVQAMVEGNVGSSARGGACYVQLPPESYPEYRPGCCGGADGSSSGGGGGGGVSVCCWWQALAESWQENPKLWIWGGVAAVLLLVILCASIIPSTRHRSDAPQFVRPPTLAAAGSSTSPWLDLAVQLDRPGVVSYVVVPTASLNAPPNGTGSSLLDQLRKSAAAGRAVYAASATPQALERAQGQARGLEQLAVACGWAPVEQGGGVAMVSVLSVPGSSSAACAAGPAANAAAHLSACARCPRLADATEYMVLLAASSPDGGDSGAVQALAVQTGASSGFITSTDPPYVTNATDNSFQLHYKLQVNGSLRYAVQYAGTYVHYAAKELYFSALQPSAGALVAGSDAGVVGGLVAFGTAAAAAPGEWSSVTVQPSCAPGLCNESLYALQPSTAYQVLLLGVDQFGNADAAPLAVPLTTAAAAAGPDLLPPSGPINITASGFSVAVNQTAAGGVYYVLLAASPGGPADNASIAAGSWRLLSALPLPTRRRLLAAGQRRRLAQGASSGGPTPGSVQPAACVAAAQPCTLSPSAALSATLARLSSTAYAPVASGCAPVPTAGQPVVLPPFSGLANNTLYYLLLATEGLQSPSPAVTQTPTVYGVRTVDLSAPRLLCGFPAITNITAHSFLLSVMLNKPGTAYYVVLPAAPPPVSPPSAAQVMQGRVYGGGAVAAAGMLGAAPGNGGLPWEPSAGTNASAGAADSQLTLWSNVTGLAAGSAYTVYVAVAAPGDGATASPGAPVTSVSGILLPSVRPPSFLNITALAAAVDEAAGTFSLQLATQLDRPAAVSYALYRNYSCIAGDPSMDSIAAGAALAPPLCTCQDASYCAAVAAGGFTVGAGNLSTTTALAGSLSPLPFQSLYNASDDQLRCFRGGLGQASDTYNIYLAASSALPTYNGLAAQCSNLAQAAASAAAGGHAIAALSCAPAASFTCGQAQLRPDTPVAQRVPVAAWNVTGGSSGDASVLWSPPPLASAHPARVQLSLDSGAPPAFVPPGPIFPTAMANQTSIGLQFALNSPALFMYEVRVPGAFDPGTNSFLADVAIASGRVPVFAAGVVTNVTVSSCMWADGPGAMVAGAQYTVRYVARDKYGRVDGPCPAARPRCTDFAFTAA